MSWLSVAIKSPIGKLIAEKLLGVVIKDNEVVQKGVLASKTVWGGILAALPSIFGAFGVQLASSEVDALISAGGVLIVVFGRIKAKVGVK